MILPTHAEKEILSELVKDYLIIRKHVRKIARDFLSKMQKSGRFIRETDYDIRTFKTASNNIWHVMIEYNQTKRVPWLFKACCIVEGDKKTKDFYIVRGVNTDSPYFVKLTSHALKRVRERNNTQKLKLGLEDMAMLAFEHGETSICMRYVDLKFNKLLQEMDNVEELDDMSYIVLTNRGVFFAKKTKEGNYVFKTYISSVMGVTQVINYQNDTSTKWTKEGELLACMILLHQYYNKSLWEKDQLENMLYKAMDKDQKIVMRDKEVFSLLRN